MNDKLEELKKLIASIEEDSPLRAQLEDALKTEEERIADECPKDDECPEDTDTHAEDSAPRTEDVNSILGALDNLVDKIDGLMQNDEFVSGVAGFVLGAAVVGLGALAFDATKRG